MTEPRRRRRKPAQDSRIVASALAIVATIGLVVGMARGQGAGQLDSGTTPVRVVPSSPGGAVERPDAPASAVVPPPPPTTSGGS